MVKKDDADNDSKIILEQSLELVKKLYDEIDASADSINTRAGIVLGLIASALTASNFSTWSFSSPFFSPKCLHLLDNLLNLGSLGLFVVGTYLIAAALLTKRLTSPYNLDSLQTQFYSDKEVDKAVYTNIEKFHGRQLDNFADSIRKNASVIEAKGSKFNCGIRAILISLALVIFSKLVL